MTKIEQLQTTDACDDRLRHLVRVNRILLILLSGALVALVWAVVGSDGPVRRSINASAAVADGLGAAVEAANPQAVGQFFAGDALFEDPAAGTRATGRSSIQAMYGSFLNATSAIENTNVLVGPGFAVTEFVWTQPCVFAACGSEVFLEPVQIRGIVLHVIENGEVVRETDYIAYPANTIHWLP